MAASSRSWRASVRDPAKRLGGAILPGHLGHKVEITDLTVIGTNPAVCAMKVIAMKHLAANYP